jgi:hypothetical protein
MLLANCITMFYENKQGNMYFLPVISRPVVSFCLPLLSAAHPIA